MFKALKLTRGFLLAVALISAVWLILPLRWAFWLALILIALWGWFRLRAAPAQEIAAPTEWYREWSLAGCLALAVGVAMLAQGIHIFNQADYDRLLYGVRTHNRAFDFIVNYDQDPEWLQQFNESVDYLTEPQLTHGLIQVAGGVVIVFCALWLLPRLPAWNIPARQPLSAPRWAGWPGLLVVGYLVLIAVSGAQGGRLRIAPLAGLSTHLQFVLLSSGIVLVTWSMGGCAWCWPRLPWRELLPLAALTGLALFVRVWRLETAVHCFVDEIHSTVAINWLNTVDDVPLMARFSEVASFPFVYPYVQRFGIEIWGANFTGVRMLSAILGTLTVPALYGLARTLFDCRTALLAALLLAVYPPHIHYSRLGINNIADPLFGVLAFAFLARGLRHGGRIDFALGGAALGLTQYFYEGGRFVYPALAALWLLGLALYWRKQVEWQGVLIALTVAALVALPVYYAMFSHNEVFGPRMGSKGVGGSYLRDLLVSPDLVRAQLWHSALPFLMYVYLPDESWFYGSDEPLLEAWAATLALVGLLFALRRMRNPTGLLLVGWLLIVTLGQGLIIESIYSPRYVVVFPALMLLIALAVRDLLEMLAALLPRLRWVRQVGWVGAFVGIALLGAGQVQHYFGPYMTHFNDYIRRNYDVEDALLRALPYPAGTHVHVIGHTLYFKININAIQTFWGTDLEVELVHPDDYGLAYLKTLSRDVDHLFFIAPDDEAGIALLRSQFNVSEPQYSPYNVPEARQLVGFYAPVIDFDQRADP